MRTHRSKSASSAMGVFLLLAVGCGHPAPPKLTRDLDLEGLEQAVRFKNPAGATVAALANQYIATGRDSDGHAYFCERAERVPDRPVFSALCGLFQARMASTVPLFRRITWVHEAMSRLDRAAVSDGLSRYFRGIVSAQLPERFGRAQQATEDLEWVLAHGQAFPPGLRRGAYAGLASAYGKLGKAEMAHQAQERAGGQGPNEPLLLTSFAVNPRDGFRFTAPALVKMASGVYVAQGYDFADIGFVITDDQVVAIDSGTSAPNARAAVAALRRITDKPIRTVILTHAHWDHVGGLSGLAGPGTAVIAQSRFAEELALANATPFTFRDFFGAATPGVLDVKPTHLVDRAESLLIGGTRFTLYPVHGGETEDALLVQMADTGVIFVGDAFMPYFGAPFAPEGSVEGLLDTIALLQSLKPTLLIHGHPPLTENFTVSVLEPLALSLRVLERDVRKTMQEGVPLADALARNVLPPELEAYPDAVTPFLLMRENATKRLYAQGTGYWKTDREGMDVFSHNEEAAALDLVASGDAQVLARAATSLADRGDLAMALKISDLALTAHPANSALLAVRTRTLQALRAKNQFNPFKFIVYSELAGAETALPPLDKQETASARRSK
jgi:glyoxylase-like metal-dependent hydrolase (beta-lactamase superfamily II)